MDLDDILDEVADIINWIEIKFIGAVNKIVGLFDFLRRKRKRINNLGYKEFNIEDVNIRIYHPQTRTIFYLGRYYYLYFPTLIFAKKDVALYIFIAIDQSLHLFPLGGSVNENGYVCLGESSYHDMNIGQLIDLFWNTEFNQFIGQKIIGRLRVWEKMSTEEIVKRCQELPAPQFYSWDGSGNIKIALENVFRERENVQAT